MNDLLPPFPPPADADADGPQPWYRGEAGAERLQRLEAFLSSPEPLREESAEWKFCHRLCTMPCGIGAFHHAGVEGTLSSVGAAELLEMLAPRLPFDELIEMLLHSNAPSELVRAMNAPPDTMLRVAARRDDVPQFVRLLDADFASVDDLMMLAVRSGSSGVVRLLMERGVAVDALLLAAALGQSGPISTEVVRLLVGAGVAKGVALTHDQLYRVAVAGVELCRVLITADSTPAEVHECLKVAAGSYQVDVMAHCLDLGASLDRRTTARSIGHSVECFRLLQSRNLIDADVLSEALKYSLGSDQCLTLLLEAGAAVDDPELLLFAARFARPTSVRLLIDAGADFRGFPLHSVWTNHFLQDLSLSRMNRAHPATLETLLAAGADIDALDKDGHSVLFTILDPIFLSLDDERHIPVLLAAAPAVPDADAVIANVIGRVETCAQEAQVFGLSEAEAQQHGASAQRVCAMLLAAGWHDPALVAGAGAAVDLAPVRAEIEAIRRRLIRPRIAEICIALQALELPALVSLSVVDAAISAAPSAAMHWKWSVITAIKHRRCSI